VRGGSWRTGGRRRRAAKRQPSVADQQLRAATNARVPSLGGARRLAESTDRHRERDLQSATRH
jgi:hypothetical protein